MNVYRLFHPITAEYTFFSSSHGTFIKIEHILGHNTHLNKFRAIQITQCMLSENSRIILEISNRKITGRSLNMWKLNNTLLNNTWVKKEIKKKVLIF